MSALIAHVFPLHWSEFALLFLTVQSFVSAAWIWDGDLHCDTIHPKSKSSVQNGKKTKIVFTHLEEAFHRCKNTL